MNLTTTTQKPIKTVAIVAKHNIAEKNLPYIKKLIAFLKKSQKKVLLDFNLEPHLSGKPGCTREQLMLESDLVITLGGDGTILKTAAHAHKKAALILGVNFGNLGFLTETTPDQLEKSLQQIFKGKYFVDERLMLRVTYYHQGKKENTFLALNEAVINQGAFPRLIKLNIQVDGQTMASFKADGLIISSPTGSTAHSLAAGGPVVHANLDAIILTPICAATLTMRPVVVPADKELAITIETKIQDKEQIGLTIDGQNTAALDRADQIKIRKSSRKFCMIRLQDHYYENLKHKLGWL